MSDEPFMEIPLTQGRVALVSPEDFDRVSKFKWFYSASQGGGGYGKRIAYVDGKKVPIWLHRFIIEAAPGETTDHINRNGLDNRRSNLRKCTQAQNLANRRGSNEFKGTTFCRRRRRWIAQIGSRETYTRLGRYATVEEAARAYDAAAVVRYGEFAYLNFPEEAGR